MTALIIVIVVVVILAGLLIVSYNGLVRSRNQVDNAWSQIDVQMKRRLDLVPSRINLPNAIRTVPASHARPVLATTNRTTKLTSSSTIVFANQNAFIDIRFDGRQQR